MNESKIMKKLVGLIFLTTAMLVNSRGFAEEFSIAAIFSDGMVLQRQEPVPVWGKADPGSVVHVTFQDQKKTATANADGKWMVRLDSMKALSTGHTMIVTCAEESRAIKDVLVGEVWFCSGQSNMDCLLGMFSGKALEERYQPIADYIANEIKSAEDPLLRQFQVQHAQSHLKVMDTTKGRWISSAPKSNASFGGTAYFFGRELRQRLNVPVGLVKSAYGGTAIEPWISKSGYMAVSKLKEKYDKTIAQTKKAIEEWDQEKVDREYQDTIKKWEAEGKKGNRPGKAAHPEKVNNPMFLATLFNGMVNPVIPYAIRGVIWYQGETNAMINGQDYQVLLEVLVNCWRKEWGDEDMPFYFAQLANWKGFTHWNWVSESIRRATGSLNNTGVAVLHDIGEKDDIHPKNKVDAGNRLAFLALKNDYKLDIPAETGPLYRSHEIKDNHIVVTFDQVGNGLMVARKDLLEEPKEIDETLRHFEVADRLGSWYPAQAEIMGRNQVKVRCKDVALLAGVRYAWKPNPEGINLYNRAGLPASLFTTESNIGGALLRASDTEEFFAALRGMGIEAVPGTVIKPAALGENLALKVDVKTMSGSVDSEKEFSNAVDGDMSTVWIPVKEKARNASLQISLGRKCRITHIAYRSPHSVWHTLKSFNLVNENDQRQICFIEKGKELQHQFFDITDIETEQIIWSVQETYWGNSGVAEIELYGVPLE